MIFRQVAEFHRAFGQLVAASPSLPDRATRQLRINLLREELDEYLQADEEDDLVEVTDALADMKYVLAGTAVSYGITPKQEGDVPFMDLSQQAAAALPSAELRAAYRDILVKAWHAYETAEHTNDIAAICAALHAFLANIASVAYAYRIPQRRVFDEVHRSNMSKLGPDGKPAFRDDGKILKPVTFSPPDIIGVLFNQSAPDRQP